MTEVTNRTGVFVPQGILSAAGAPAATTAPAEPAAPHPATPQPAPAQRAEPYLCPFCGEADLRPVEDGMWHCRTCLRLFGVSFHGLRQPPAPPAPAKPEPVRPSTGVARDLSTLDGLEDTPEAVAAALAADPEAFAARADSYLDGHDAATVLSWAAKAFGGGLAVTAAMGDTVLAHIASRAVPGVDVLFVDTGYHFPETVGVVDAVRDSYPVRLLSITPVQSKADHEAERGQLWKTNPDQCCKLRKVTPLNDALAGYQAWATGLRRDDSLDRACTPTVSWDPKRKLLKLAPIAAWTDEDVETYLGEHPDVVVNPLVQLGYRSVGCAPCTRAVDAGEHARAGRWAGLAKTECGIHI